MPLAKHWQNFKQKLHMGKCTWSHHSFYFKKEKWLKEWTDLSNTMGNKLKSCVIHKSSMRRFLPHAGAFFVLGCGAICLHF